MLSPANYLWKVLLPIIPKEQAVLLASVYLSRKIQDQVE